MVHNQPSNQLSIRIHLVLHLHHFNHVQIDRFEMTTSSWFSRLDSEDRIDDVCGEFLSEDGVEFGRKGGMGNGDQVCSVEIWSLLI